MGVGGVIGMTGGVTWLGVGGVIGTTGGVR